MDGCVCLYRSLHRYQVQHVHTYDVTGFPKVRSGEISVEPWVSPVRYNEIIRLGGWKKDMHQKNPFSG